MNSIVDMDLNGIIDFMNIKSRMIIRENRSDNTHIDFYISVTKDGYMSLAGESFILDMSTGLIYFDETYHPSHAVDNKYTANGGCIINLANFKILNDMTDADLEASFNPVLKYVYYNMEEVIKNVTNTYIDETLLS